MEKPSLEVCYLESMGHLFSRGLGLGVVILDSSRRVAHWNGWMERHSGITEKSILGEVLTRRFPDIEKRGKDRYLRECIEKGVPHMLSARFHGHFIPLTIYKQGEARPMRQNVKIYPTPDARPPCGAIIIIDDITESVLHEREIEKLTGMLSAIRNINRSISHVRSQAELFQSVCQSVTDNTGISCVWIGEVLESPRKIIPKYCSGEKIETIRQCQYGWGDDSWSMGPIRQTVLTGRNQVVDEIANSPSCNCWEDFCRQIDCRSVCVLPIVVDCAIRYVLVAYSREKRFFGQEMTSLLDEIVSDVAFGIGALRETHRRKMAERALNQEKERLRTTLQSIVDAVIAVDLEGRVVLMNRRAEKLTGWRTEDASGSLVDEVLWLVSPGDDQKLENPVPQLMQNEGDAKLEQKALLISKEGGKRHIFLTGAKIIGEEKILYGTVLVFREINQD